MNALKTTNTHLNTLASGSPFLALCDRCKREGVQVPAVGQTK